MSINKPKLAMAIASPTRRGPQWPLAPDKTGTGHEAKAPAKLEDFFAYSDWCFGQIKSGDYEYIMVPRPPVPACPWCGGRTVHSEACNELRMSWEPVLPWGKHRGKRISEVPSDYLLWLLGREGVSSDLADAIRAHLDRTIVD